MLLDWKWFGMASILSPCSLTPSQLWLLLKCPWRSSLCHLSLMVLVPQGSGTPQKALAAGGHSADPVPSPTPCSYGLRSSGKDLARACSGFHILIFAFFVLYWEEQGGGKEQITECSSRTGPWRAPVSPFSRCSSSGDPSPPFFLGLPPRELKHRAGP